MARLITLSESHIYEVDGVKLPSVSEIIRFISREEYGDIDQYTLDNAAKRGTEVHKAIEQIIKFGEAEVTEDIDGYVQAFVKYCKENNVIFKHSERSLACDEYAGTIDIIAEVKGELSIIDIKTTSVVKKTLVKAQLNLYRRLVECNKIGEIKSLYCLQLKSDGKYTLYPVAIDDTEANACLALHRAMAKKHTRGQIT